MWLWAFILHRKHLQFNFTVLVIFHSCYRWNSFCYSTKRSVNERQDTINFTLQFTFHFIDGNNEAIDTICCHHVDLVEKSEGSAVSSIVFQSFIQIGFMFLQKITDEKKNKRSMSILIHNVWDTQYCYDSNLKTVFPTFLTHFWMALLNNHSCS